MNLLEKSTRSPILERSAIEISLETAIVSIVGDEPNVLVRSSERDGGLTTLPSGLYDPFEHDSFEEGLRTALRDECALELGFVEQLRTFDCDRLGGIASDLPKPPRGFSHRLSIGYLALTRQPDAALPANCEWRSWYDFMPWEDWRRGKPSIVTESIEPFLASWMKSPDCAMDLQPASDRRLKVEATFGLNGGWDEEMVLERTEVLIESGYLRSDPVAVNGSGRRPLPRPAWLDDGQIRVLASAAGRLRAKLKYRPVIFDLIPQDFTLFELQRAVEAILGSHLHKQNFRRLVEAAGLVETTGEVRTHTGGRPAKLFRFRRSVLSERSLPGVRVRASLG